MVEALDLAGADEGPFTDVDPDSVHARNINALAAHDIATGTIPSTFDPQGQVTRAQIASLLIRALDDLGS